MSETLDGLNRRIRRWRNVGSNKATLCMQDDQSIGESLQFLAIHLSSIRSPLFLLLVHRCWTSKQLSLREIYARKKTPKAQSGGTTLRVSIIISATSNNAEARPRWASRQRSSDIPSLTYRFPYPIFNQGAPRSSKFIEYRDSSWRESPWE